MKDCSTTPDAAPRAAPPPLPASAELASADLLAGRREVLIRHGDELYRLRLTGSNKLILTK